jgi:hypothetical protein
MNEDEMKHSVSFDFKVGQSVYIKSEDKFGWVTHCSYSDQGKRYWVDSNRYGDELDGNWYPKGDLAAGKDNYY